MNFTGLMNKKGQGLSVNAIILIILGLVILVMLILGFVFGWNNILPFVSKSNVANLKTACSIACSTNAEFDFCSVKRELKSDTETLKDVTCNYLVQKQPKYNIENCNQISCDAIVLVQVDTEALLQEECSKQENQGKATVQALIGDTLTTYDCPVPTEE